MKVVDMLLPEGQYYNSPQKKTQIVLHHTVSNPFSAKGDVDFWASDPTRVATYAVISYDGTINRCFPSNVWAHHLGVKAEDLKLKGFKDYATRNEELNKASISIELDCWGGLVKKPDGFYNAYGQKVDPSKFEIGAYAWRGYTFFQKYSQAQIDTLKELLPVLMERYQIPNYGLKEGFFNLRYDALQGVPGIFSHSNYRSDKSDLYPDERIVELLKTL